MAAKNKTILLTGANGMIGFRVLADLLHEPLYDAYTIRCAVRDTSTFAKLLTQPSVAGKAHRIQTVTVPDMTVPNAYKDAIVGVEYAIHVAAPLASPKFEGQDYDQVIIQPSVNGTVRMLEAAIGEPSVRRVAITASVASFGEWGEGTLTEAASPEPAQAPFESVFGAYKASKVLAFQASEEFMKQRKPHFDLVNLHPCFVIGPDETVLKTQDITRGTNGLVMAPILGHLIPNETTGNAVHIKDVSKAHVVALNKEKVPPGSYLLTSGVEGMEWGQSFDIVRRRFPKDLKNGILTLNEAVRPRTALSKVDPSKAARVLGIEFASFEEQVVDLVKYYLDLVKKQQQTI